MTLIYDPSDQPREDEGCIDYGHARYGYRGLSRPKRSEWRYCDGKRLTIATCFALLLLQSRSSIRCCPCGIVRLAMLVTGPLPRDSPHLRPSRRPRRIHPVPDLRPLPRPMARTLPKLLVRCEGRVRLRSERGEAECYWRTESGDGPAAGGGCTEAYRGGVSDA